MVYESKQDLPEKRADIYKQCIETLLEKWDTTRDIRRRRKFKTEYKQQLLTEIAWHFHIRPKRYNHENELLKVIADFLPTVNLSSSESKAILHEIEAENGLLKEQAHEWHGFLHLTLQEYFVAQYLDNTKNGHIEILNHCGDPWWEEVMLLYAGSVYDASPLLHAFLRQEKSQHLWKDIFHTPLIWAGQCLTAKPRLTQRPLRDEILIRLFSLLRNTPYSLTREQVIKIVLQIEGNDARGEILSILKNKQDDVDIRELIVNALGELGSQVSTRELLTILKDKQENSYVRNFAPRALADLGERSVVPELLTILKDKQENSSVREQTTIALEELEKQLVVPSLITVLKDKQDAVAVRRSILFVLGKLGDLSVVSELLDILKDKQDKLTVRAYTAFALGRLGDLSVIPDLLIIVKDKQEKRNIRVTVARMLVRLGKHDEILPYLYLIVNAIYSIDSDDESIPSELLWNYTSIRAFAQTLKRRKFRAKNAVHRALWEAGQREKVRILMLDWKFIKLVRVVRQQHPLVPTRSQTNL